MSAQQSLKRLYGNHVVEMHPYRPDKRMSYLDTQIALDNSRAFPQGPYPRMNPLYEADGRSLENTPWLFPRQPWEKKLKKGPAEFVPDPYLNGENWTQEEIPHYIGPITAQMERERVVYVSPFELDYTSTPQSEIRQLAPEQVIAPQQPALQQPAPQHPETTAVIRRSKNGGRTWLSTHCWSNSK